MQMPGSSTLRVVNILPLESYLRGVIAMEMPPSAPPAALAAQAICARTHALKSRVRFRAQGYDVVDTTACQVYGGMDAERATTDAAVVATKGQVLARKGELIWGDYYDDCGGVTAAGEHEEDYPPSIVDAPKAGEPPFCAQGTYHTWEWTLSPGELVKRLGEARKERLGNIINIAITETDASGRARRVRLEGVHGTEEMKATQLRAMLGYDRLRSTLFTVSRGEGGVFLFKGRGNGHGHGLCQRGAMAMAGPPYNRTMEQILAHYFPGADILPLTSLSTGRE
jgi:stage II sporulation protein D